MFFSLNKKFFFTIFAFFILSAVVFTIIFEGSVGKKIRAEHSDIITRNQYVIELLNENINLRKELRTYQPEGPKMLSPNLSQKQEELSRERRLNEELMQNYNENYAALTETLRIIFIGAILTLASLLIFWLLLHIWVITPINRLTKLSSTVAEGDFTKRLPTKRKRLTDEFDTLSNTVNFMLNNIEANITEIKEKEVFLQNLIDAIPDAVRVIDEDYNIILQNKAYHHRIKQHYFCPAQKCYGAYDKEAQEPCNTNQYLCPLLELKKNPASIVKCVHTVNDRPLSVSSARIFLNGKTGLVESFRDLSDNVNYSHQQKISSLGFLATSLAHEMKNNLGAIKIILNGLLQKYYPEGTPASEQQTYLEMISNQINECINVPERLLKLSRTNDASLEPFNITGGIEDVLSLLDYEIKRKGITLTKSFSNLSEKLNGNETDFKMIILNLSQNAINAMPNGGTLDIKTNTNKDNLIINIKDTGCGISKEALKHIFEPFYTSDKSPEHIGTGLGLAIVKDLVHKFNGKITVSSTENIGSDFQIEIPRHKIQKTLVK